MISSYKLVMDRTTASATAKYLQPQPHIDVHFTTAETTTASGMKTTRLRL